MILALSRDRLALMLFSLLILGTLVWSLLPVPPLVCREIEWNQLMRWKSLRETTVLLAECNVADYDEAYNVTRRAWRSAALRLRDVDLCFHVSDGARYLIQVLTVHGSPRPTGSVCHPEIPNF